MGVNQRIVTAVRQLITARGFKGWTMEELARLANVSKRTLYRYYPGKEALIAGVIDDFLTSLGSTVDETIAAQAPPQQIVRTVLPKAMNQGSFIINTRSLEDLRSIYPHLWEKIEDFRTGKIQNMINYFISQSSSASLSNLDSRIIAAAVTASIQAVINPTFILDNNLTFEEAGKQLIQFLLASFDITWE